MCSLLACNSYLINKSLTITVFSSKQIQEQTRDSLCGKEKFPLQEKKEISLLILADRKNSKKYTELIYLNLTRQVRSRHSVQAGNTNFDSTLPYKFTPLVLVSSKHSRPFPARLEGDVWILSCSPAYFTVLFILQNPDMQHPFLLVQCPL